MLYRRWDYNIIITVSHLHLVSMSWRLTSRSKFAATSTSTTATTVNPPGNKRNIAFCIFVAKMTRTPKRKTTLSEGAEDIRSPKKRFVEEESSNQNVETAEDKGDKDSDEKPEEPEISRSSEPSDTSGGTPAPSNAKERMDRFKALQARAVSTSPSPPYSRDSSSIAKPI